MQKIILLLVIFLVLFFTPAFASAQVNTPQEQRIEAQITQVLEEKEEMVNGKLKLYQKFELVGLSGKYENKLIQAESGNIISLNSQKFKVGDKVVVTEVEGPEGQKLSFISDFIRRDTLYILAAIFAVTTILIGKKRGFFSLLGLAYSFFILFSFVLPQILKGNDPVLIAILGSIFIIPVTFSLSHGLNRKTLSAMLSTVASLIITGILASFFVEAGKLSGFAAEEVGFLQSAKEGAINVKGLLLAGIIISALGVLDDITISQSAVVAELKKSLPNLSKWELYDKAMNIGRDHIASVVNTLVLVYTGAAMPLLLLFINNPHPVFEVINYEIVAEEIIKTLVASIGLILAVPISSLLAAFLVDKKSKIF